MHDRVRAQGRCPAVSDERAATAGAESVGAVRCVDAALWHERSVLAALVTALSGPRRCEEQDSGTEPLLRELRMARLLSSVEVSAMNGIWLTSGASVVSALGRGWATVLDEHDEALERLADELDASSAARRDAAR